jgi:hypothetical protein
MYFIGFQYFLIILILFNRSDLDCSCLIKFYFVNLSVFQKLIDLAPK